MKKPIAIFAVLLFVAPAFAADWSFYGSERMATWYVSQDFGSNQVAGQDNDAGTQWYLQTNSRFGAKVKADKVSGHIELATTASTTDSAGDGVVNTRRAYGVWKFSDTGSLKVGKDYSATYDPISNSGSMLTKTCTAKAASTGLARPISGSTSATLRSIS